MAGRMWGPIVRRRGHGVDALVARSLQAPRLATLRTTDESVKWNHAAKSGILRQTRVTPTEARGVRLQAPPRRLRFGASVARLLGGTRAPLPRGPLGTPVRHEILVGPLRPSMSG